MTPEDIVKIVEAVKKSNDSDYILLILFIIVIVMGVYLTAYLKDKAKHLATKEEHQHAIDRLSDQIEATKGIEAKYANAIFGDQQKHRYMQETLGSLLKHLYMAKEAMREIAETHYREEELKHGKHMSSRVPMSDEAWSKRFEIYEDNITEANEYIGQACMYLDEDSLQALKEIEKQKFTDGDDYDEYLKNTEKYISAAFDTILAFSRKIFYNKVS